MKNNSHGGEGGKSMSKKQPFFGKRKTGGSFGGKTNSRSSNRKFNGDFKKSSLGDSNNDNKSFGNKKANNSFEGNTNKKIGNRKFSNSNNTKRFGSNQNKAFGSSQGDVFGKKTTERKFGEKSSERTFKGRYSDNSNRRNGSERNFSNHNSGERSVSNRNSSERSFSNHNERSFSKHNENSFSNRNLGERSFGEKSSGERRSYSDNRKAFGDKRFDNEKRTQWNSNGDRKARTNRFPDKKASFGNKRFSDNKKSFENDKSLENKKSFTNNTSSNTNNTSSKSEEFTWEARKKKKVPVLESMSQSNYKRVDSDFKEKKAFSSFRGDRESTKERIPTEKERQGGTEKKFFINRKGEEVRSYNGKYKDGKRFYSAEFSYEQEKSPIAKTGKTRTYIPSEDGNRKNMGKKLKSDSRSDNDKKQTD